MKKNILVTGSGGFVASNFTRLFQNHPHYELFHMDELQEVSDRKFWKTLPESNKLAYNVADITVDDLKEWRINYIIHMAARSHVDASISDPLSFTQDNVVATHHLFEACRVYGKVKKIVLVSCYDENTRALTTDGFKTYDQINIGDIVISINPETGKIEEKEVLEVIIQDYQGKMIQFDNHNSNSCVTPNHRVFYRNTVDEIVWTEAENTLKKSLGYVLQGEFDGKESKTTFVDGIGDVNTDLLFYMCGVFIGDGFLATQKQHRPTKSGLSKIEKDKHRNEKGHFIKFDKPLGNHVSEIVCHRIFWDIPEKDKARSRLEETFQKLGIKYSAQKGKAGEHLYFSSKEWSVFFEQFGKGFRNKNVPRWMKEYDKSHLKNLFDGLIDSDGHYIRETGLSFSTSSEKLLADICEIGIKLGYVSRFDIRGDVNCFYEKEDRYIKSTCPAYMIYFKNHSEKYNFFLDKYEKEYAGKIWCLKVKDNGNFTTERFGKLRICGNTDEVMGSLSVTDPPFREDDPIQPNSPYSASKASQELLARAYHETYGLPIAITRCSNNFGPYQDKTKLIPKAMKCLLDGKKIPVYGDGKNIRDWIKVDDHCRGVMAALERGNPGEVYHLGSNNEMTNLDILELLIIFFPGYDALANDWMNHIEFVGDRLGHDRRYAMNSYKTNKELEWFATDQLMQTSIIELWEWAYSNLDWFKD